MNATTPVPYRAAARRREVADTVTLVLEPCGAPIPEVRPGRFTMLYAFGVGEAPISVGRCGAVLERPPARTDSSAGPAPRAVRRWERPRMRRNRPRVREARRGLRGVSSGARPAPADRA